MIAIEAPAPEREQGRFVFKTKNPKTHGREANTMMDRLMLLRQFRMQYEEYGFQEELCDIDFFVFR